MAASPSPPGAPVGEPPSGSPQSLRPRVFRTILVMFGAAALLAAPATPDPPGSGPQRGVVEHHGPNGEIDVDLCSDQIPEGASRCLARQRVDTNAKTLKPAPRGKLATNDLVGDNGAYSPAYLQSAYNVPSDKPGATVAVVDAFDDSRAESDLAYYRSYFGLPACTTANGCFRKVDQRGGTNYPAGNGTWATETSLDLDMVSAICPNCKILLVEADTNYTPDLGAAVNTAVALGASAVSNSYGRSEYSGEASDNGLYYDHPGVAVVASSGDGGYGTQFPAASPDVVAVGGTTLHQATSTGTRDAAETVWSGSGSGCSLFMPKPSWQHDTGCSGRAIADVSAVADPSTGVWVWDTYPLGGGWTILGGTSVAAPIVAALYGLTGNPAGSSVDMPAAPYGDVADLNDVTSGSNGSCGSYLCTAAAGYDGPTGLGTPNGATPFLSSWVPQAPQAPQAPPPAPTQLTAVFGHSIDLTWSAPAGSAQVVGYVVERGGVEIARTTQTSYADQTVSAGQTYSYDVRAYDAAGDLSAPSNVATASVPAADTTPPSAPSSLSAKALSSTQAALYWSGAKDNVGIAEYDVYRNGVLVGSTSSPNFEDSGLTPAGKYTYAVKTRDTAGNVSAVAKTVNVSLSGTSTTGSIAGFATNAQSKLPLGNVKVSATLNGKTTSQSSNGSGFYLLSHLAPGTYTVTVSATGYATQTSTVVVAANLATLRDLSLG
jgi:chitodextrinase